MSRTLYIADETKRLLAKKLRRIARRIENGKISLISFSDTTPGLPIRASNILTSPQKKLVLEYYKE